MVTLIIAVTHQGEFPRFLLGFELLVGIGLYLQVRFLKEQVRAYLKIPEMYGRKKEDFKIEINITNKSHFPIPEIRVEMGCRDVYTGDTGSLSGVAMVDAKGKAGLSFRLKADYCGIMEFWLERVTFSDYLGVFTGSCEKKSEIQQIAILPVCKEETDASDARTQIFSADGTIFELHKVGDDPAETYDIREFRAGDTMHRIHWNMTAKKDELLIRDFSQPLESTTLLLLDLQKEEEITREQWDNFLEAAASLSKKLVSLGYVHYVAWMDGTTGEVVRFRVGNEDELMVMLSVLLRGSVYHTGDIGTSYKENYIDEAHSEIIRINLEGKIRRESRKE